MENSEAVPQILKNRNTISSNNPTSGRISRGNKTVPKRYLKSYVYYSIIHNHQDMDAPYVSSNRWIKLSLKGTVFLFEVMYVF